MKKTVTANVGGVNFHLDEDAFSRLSNYLESIRHSLSGTEGADEIMQDIEARIAELLHGRIKSADRVVNLDDVKEIILVMGKPEDFAGDSSESEKRSEPAFTIPESRKLFRDPDDKVLGGVCSGIGAYFSLEPIWIRIVFALLFVSFGTGFALYLILWLVIPKAKTTADRLRMRGEPINVANIEKNIREEMEELRQRAEKATSRGRKTALPLFQRFFDGLGDLLRYAVTAAAKILAFILMLFGLLVAFVLFAAFFGVTTHAPGVSFPWEIESLFRDKSSFIWTMIGAALVAGIPFLLIGLYGLRNLFGTRSSKTARWVIVSLWISGLVILLVGGLNVVYDFRTESSVRKEIVIDPPAGKTIIIDSPDEEAEFKGEDDFIEIESGKVRFSNLVKLDIRPSADSSFHLVQKLSSFGRNQQEAKESASTINYNFNISDSILNLPKSFDWSNIKTYRGQHMVIILLVPEGAIIRLENSLKNMLQDVSNRQNIFDEDMVGRTWQMQRDGLDCIDCNGSETTVD